MISNQGIVIKTFGPKCLY